jgi:capsular polysaccharide biosynthesis protein
MKKRFSFMAVALLAFVQQAMAQGVTGIDAASSELTTYVDPIGTLIIVIGAIVGLVGGVRVFIKWNSGDQDVQKSIMGWMGSCVFLMLVGVVVKAFFGV